MFLQQQISSSFLVRLRCASLFSLLVSIFKLFDDVHANGVSANANGSRSSSSIVDNFVDENYRLERATCIYSFSASVRVGLFIFDRLATVFVTLRFNPQMAVFSSSLRLSVPLRVSHSIFISQHPSSRRAHFLNWRRWNVNGKWKRERA